MSAHRNFLMQYLHQHRALLFALTGSLIIHALLFLPAPFKQELEIKTQKVTLSKIQQDNVQFEQQQKKQEAEVAVSSKENQTAPSPINKTNVKSTVQPIVHEQARAAQQEVSGLAIKQDEVSVDPLQRTYEQTLLAHLRNKISAPKQLNGQVRLSIQFSYRQIATDVKVIDSSGDPAVDDWAVKSVFAANPFPAIPKELPESFIFRPTLKIAP